MISRVPESQPIFVLYFPTYLIISNNTNTNTHSSLLTIICCEDNDSTVTTHPSFVSERFRKSYFEIPSVSM